MSEKDFYTAVELSVLLKPSELGELDRLVAERNAEEARDTGPGEAIVWTRSKLLRSFAVAEFFQRSNCGLSLLGRAS